METVNTDMLRGRVDIFVLKALSESDGYGYDILNYIHSRTEGHYEMKQSSVYSVLKRLEKQGYVYSYIGDETNGAKRRYYSLTDAGKQMLADEEKEWAYTRTLLDNLVSDRSFDLKTDTPPFHPSDLRPLTRRSSRIDEEDFDSLPNTDSSVSPTISSTDSSDNIVKADNIVKTDKHSEENIEKTVIEESASSDDKTVSLNEEAAATIADSPIFEDSAFKLPDDDVPAEEPHIIEQKVEQTIERQPQRNTFTLRNNYRDFFGNLFSNNKKESTEHLSTNPIAELEQIDCSHINDLRNRLDKEGFKLRSYEPANSGKGLMRYVLVNKLIRDSVILSYLFLVIMLLIVFLCKPFNVSLDAFLIVGGIALIAPAACLLISINNPEKRIKDNINIKIILAICGIVYLAFFIINLIISLLIPNGYSLNSAPTYAPAIICLTVPMFGVFLSILYKTNNYHLKNV